MIKVPSLCKKEVQKENKTLKKCGFFSFQWGIESNGIERLGTYNPLRRSIITKFVSPPM
jgi:hypothetical protein